MSSLISSPFTADALQRAPFVLLEDSRALKQNQKTSLGWGLSHDFSDFSDSSRAQKKLVSQAEPDQALFFNDPCEIIRADDWHELPKALARLDALAQQGLYLAGWIAFEACAYFEPRLSGLFKKPDEPLLWMIATEKLTRLTRAAIEAALDSTASGNERQASLTLDPCEAQKNQFADAFAASMAHIEAGNIYQLNLTFPIAATLKGDKAALYKRLRARQPVPYSAFIDSGDWHILSLSPELFVARHQDTLRAEPMKGTHKRGRYPAEDLAASRFLQQDLKSRAENMMIVDLLRNDLAKICRPGSVRVDPLFAVTAYPSLWQMTSRIHGQLMGGPSCGAQKSAGPIAGDPTKENSKANASNQANKISPSQLLAALFPCGSVTGAPKISALTIISQIETHPRGVYCGAIGHISPDGNWAFNVPIRTLIFPQSHTGIHHGRLHVGAGLVADSKREDEYAECLLKARFAADLTLSPQGQADKRHNFALIETIGLEAGKSSSLCDHLNRLEASARYFNFNFQRAAIETTLDSFLKENSLNPNRPYESLRLLLKADGILSLSLSPFTPFSPTDAPVALGISTSSIRSDDVFLFHKTTNRRLYTHGLKAAKAAGLFDLIYANEQGEICETSIANIIIAKDGQLFTPALNCGRLAGLGLQRLQKEKTITEARLSLKDLQQADKIWLINSLRGLFPAQLTDQKIDPFFTP